MAGERDLVTGVIQLANLLNRRLAPVFEKAKVTPQQWAVLVRAGGRRRAGDAGRAGATPGRDEAEHDRHDRPPRTARRSPSGRAIRTTCARRACSSPAAAAASSRSSVPRTTNGCARSPATAFRERELQTLTQTVERLIARWMWSRRSVAAEQRRAAPTPIAGPRFFASYRPLRPRVAGTAPRDLRRRRDRSRRRCSP